MKRVTFLMPWSVFFCFFSGPGLAQSSVQRPLLQLIFTSDAHYGLTRPSFRADTAVSAQVVNEAMIDEMDRLPAIAFPMDGGVAAGKKVRTIDYLVEGGDIANRMQVPLQSDSASWNQFISDYTNRLTLTAANGARTSLLIIPGNHDITNAIGFYKKMIPRTDPTSMVAIYNLMVRPAEKLTEGHYNYAFDKVNYSRNIDGIHFMFITLWPDSSERIWMEKDLRSVSPGMPVILFTHDQPECEAKHFTNPDKARGINATDRFEDLLDEVYKDSTAAPRDGGTTAIEQRGWVAFLKKHPNIKAYFHGNDNFNQFYTYTGPDHNISLPVFRVDSPMKGNYSSKNERLLSFLVISIDTVKRKMTVRECLWNTDPSHPAGCIKWGASKTINL